MPAENDGGGLSRGSGRGLGGAHGRTGARGRRTPASRRAADLCVRDQPGRPAEFAEHIGRPLTSVPDPCGLHPNWAEHFKDPLRESLARLGVRVTEISQAQMYTSGAYTEQIVLAMRRRAGIGSVLARY